MWMVLLGTLRQVLASRAALQVGLQIMRRSVNALANRRARRADDRHSFLVWLSGQFQWEQPEAHRILWERVHDQDDVIDTLANVFVPLHAADPDAAVRWFTLRADESESEFERLIAKLTPRGGFRAEDLSDRD